MNVHNEINFPQAKLDSGMNVPFHLNEHGDLYFLSHNASVHNCYPPLIKKMYKNFSSDRKEM